MYKLYNNKIYLHLMGNDEKSLMQNALSCPLSIVVGTIMYSPGGRLYL